MARDSGIKIGAGGRGMIQEIIEEPQSKPRKKKETKKTQVLEERVYSEPDEEALHLGENE